MCIRRADYRGLTRTPYPQPRRLSVSVSAGATVTVTVRERAPWLTYPQILPPCGHAH
jgi:hypothetical protein